MHKKSNDRPLLQINNNLPYRIIMSSTDKKVFKHPLGTIALLNDTNYACCISKKMKS